MLFLISYQLCKTYPALSPFEIDRKTYEEVIDLYADTRRIQLQKMKEKEEPKKDKVIRRPAGDDWF